MKIGSIGYIISLISIGFCFIYSSNSYLLLAFILIFIASHAIGQGTVIWVFISEIFPNSVRAKGQSLGTATHWVFAALITALTPFVIDLLGNNPGIIFYFFGGMMVIQLLFVYLIMCTGDVGPFFTNHHLFPLRYGPEDLTSKIYFQCLLI